MIGGTVSLPAWAVLTAGAAFLFYAGFKFGLQHCKTNHPAHGNDAPPDADDLAEE